MSDRLTDRRRVLQLTGGALLSGLAGCAAVDSGGGADGTETGTAATETTGGGSTSAVDLVVSDAETDTPKVSIDRAAIDRDGWLVIHPAADGGGPNGSVTLARVQLDAGSDDEITTTIDRLLKGDQTLYAMLHYDDPADGEFTFPEDGDPPVTADGGPVVEPFTVTGTGDFAPALSVPDQPTDGSKIMVEGATIDEAGWLVVHPEADGGGPNGGVTYAARQLPAGTYRDLWLELTEQVSGDQTLYAMLHYDDPADGEFTFPEDGDPPVEIDGAPAVRSFDVEVGTSGGDGTPSTASVELRDTSFDPPRLSVPTGTKVTWTNRDAYGHDVTSAAFHDVAASWDYASETLEQGETATHTFEESGVYEYYCTIHGEDTMCGAILVGDVSLERDLPCESGGGGGGAGY